MVRNALDLIKVTLAEHFVVSGDRYVGIMQELSVNYSQSPYLDDFIKARGDGERSYSISEETILRLNTSYNVDDSEYFARLLSYAGRGDKSQEALSLLRRFRTIEAIFDASIDELKKYVSDTGALYIKLLAYVTSRRVTDKYSFDRKYSIVQIAEYLKGLYIGETEEEIYLLCFDSKDRFIASELVGVGTVNTSEVLPRKLLERAIRCSAKKVILAHNHPGGRADPSVQDISAVNEKVDLFRCSGIELVADCVIAGQKCAVMNCSGIKTIVL
jgi:DNA repair protein RadC